ncbi:hypothetical protein EHP00_287 [Ecytonucleospora hepatopenaei]|uniref:Uncharacterized protein n=1 Tax=Ecytonucleospora hepatopenaei TaxID=646526 RepID=A0A1W0E7B0_9MICR|nr:hypothetical protein EHP00_287 [Ecytonucleospora hepatopenaei]
MFFKPKNEITVEDIKLCRNFATSLNYSFDDEAIEIMLRMLKEKIVSSEKLYKILSKTKKELEK